jgi:hypothetical protein
LRAIIVLGALAAGTGCTMYQREFGLLRFVSSEEIVAYFLSVPVLVVAALIGLISGRRAVAGGVAFAVGVGVAAFDLAEPLRYLFKADHLLGVGLQMVALGCVALIIGGLLLMTKEPSIGAGRVLLPIVAGLVIAVPALPAHELIAFDPSLWAVSYAIGAILLVAASIFARGGAVPLTAGLHGLALILVRVNAIFTFEYVAEENPAMLVLAFGFFLLAAIGLGRALR